MYGGTTVLVPVILVLATDRFFWSGWRLLSSCMRLFVTIGLTQLRTAALVAFLFVVGVVSSLLPRCVLMPQLLAASHHCRLAGTAVSRCVTSCSLMLLTFCRICCQLAVCQRRRTSLCWVGPRGRPVANGCAVSHSRGNQIDLAAVAAPIAVVAEPVLGQERPRARACPEPSAAVRRLNRDLVSGDADELCLQGASSGSGLFGGAC